MGFRVWGLGFRQGLGFRVSGLGFRVPNHRGRGRGFRARTNKLMEGP